MIQLTKEEVLTLLKAMSQVEGYVWSTDCQSDKLNKVLSNTTEFLAEKLNES